MKSNLKSRLTLLLAFLSLTVFISGMIFTAAAQEI